MQELPKPLLPSKEMVESEIASLRAENKRLEAEKEQIHEDRQALQSRVSELEKNLQQEVERLQAEKSETDGFQSDLGSKEEEAERLLLEVEKLERINEESRIELWDLRSERYGLLEENKEREKKFELMAEEFSSIVQSMLVAQKYLEERLERREEFALEKDGIGLKGAAKMDGLRSDLELKKEEAEKLLLEVEKLKRINEENLIEHRELRRERDALLEEKKEREIVQSMLVAQTNLEERLERREELAVEKDGMKRASFGLKGAAKMMKSLTGRWMRRRS